jgi:hypothetical protein
MDHENRLFLEVSDPPQSLFEDILFPADLGSIIHVHPLATAAKTEPLTGWIPALGRALDDLIELGEINPSTAADLP